MYITGAGLGGLDVQSLLRNYNEIMKKILLTFFRCYFFYLNILIILLYILIIIYLYFYMTKFRTKKNSI